MILDLSTLSLPDRQHWLQHAIAPRPICFAGTIDSEGNVNLSPFSFFNMFSINPPIVVFSPSRRGRDNTTKHTLDNVLDVAEVSINVVDFDMVQQTSLASCEYGKQENESTKAGFTMEPATLIRPPMVKEAKIKMECKVIEVKSLGAEGGAGQLVIAEVLRMHVSDEVLGADGKIDALKLKLVARLGGDWYCKVDETNLFQVAKPSTELGIGVDALPENIRNSTILTGNNLGQLANIETMPVVDAAFEDEKVKNIFQYYSIEPEELDRELHLYAKDLLEKGNLYAAWQVLLSF